MNQTSKNPRPTKRARFEETATSENNQEAREKFLRVAQERMKLFPSLYENEKQALDALEKFAVFHYELDHHKADPSSLVLSSLNVSSALDEEISADEAPAASNNFSGVENAVAGITDNSTAPESLMVLPTKEGVTGESTTSASSIITTRQQSYTQADIWGRIPTKEPKFLVKCSICNRMVNTLRFASHLDKCMGIGTTVRAATMAGTGTRNNSNR